MSDIPFPDDQEPAVNGALAPIEPFQPDRPVQAYQKPAVPPVRVREIPHNLEAEQQLLSACLIDDGATLDACIAAKLQASTFYDAKHGAIFDTLVAMRAAKLPIETSVLAQELTSSGKLKEIGGYPFVLQISGASPTTAEATYHLEKVIEQATLREIIRTANATVEDCYNHTGDLSELLTHTSVRLKVALERGTPRNALLDRLEASRFNVKRRLPDIVPILSMRDTPVATSGNLSTLTGPSKAGKSSTITGILAATFHDPEFGGDTFTFNGRNTREFAVIHIDTEQHGKDHERMMDMVLKRAGVTAPPAWFNSYSRKGASAKELRDELEFLMMVKAKAHGGIHMVVLDGVADYVNDVNDAKECNPFVTWLEALAVKYDCHILCVIHLNPLSGNVKDAITKSRGHLGSQLLRKCETDIRLKKNGDEVTVIFTESQGTRRKPVFEKDGPCFKWDPEAGMHMTCKGESAVVTDEKRDSLRDLMEDVFAASVQKSLRYHDLVKAVMTAREISKATAERRCKDSAALGVITKDFMGFWSMNKTT
jgi:hypothetical protein